MTEVEELAKALEAYKTKVIETAEAESQHAEIIELLRINYGKQDEALDDAVDAYDKLHGTYDDGRDALEKFLEEQNKLYKTWTDQQSLLRRVRNLFEDLDEAIEELEESIED